MVRRRTRASKQTSAALTNGVPAVGVPPNLLEEQYFASPKRKDCKVDCSSDSGPHCEEVTVVFSQSRSPSNTAKTKSDRNAARTIGVPLATRSQTRTIENFFKAKTASAKIKENGIDLKGGELQNHKELSLPAPPIQCESLHIASEFTNSNGIAMPSSQTDLIFDLSDDTNDGETETVDRIEVSEEATTINNLVGINMHISEHDVDDYGAHRVVTLDDSYSSRSSTNTDNIFLQEPVLTLNVDKTLNQASSIKINKTIEVEPVFSSPPALAATATALHGRFNQIVSLNGCGGTNSVRIMSPTKSSFAFESIATGNNINHHGCYVLLPENDNSSCDSGVEFSSSSIENSNKSNTSTLVTGSPFNCNNADIIDPNQGATRRRKPATPHRILCPSPTKPVSRTISHSSRVISPTAAGRKKEQILSPRKSPRHLPIQTYAATAVITTKSRRRLNPQPQQQQPHQTQHKEKDKAPYPLETTKTVVQNGYKLQNGNIEYIADDDGDDFKIINDQTEEEFENFDSTSNIANSKITAPQIKTTSSNVLETTGTKTTAGKVNHAVVVKQQQQNSLPPKSTTNVNNIKHKMPQPLTSTNSGNRELTEFFPVRRSVRKTKTAVKEEMMRSLEQAVLEERAEGLKIAHFEGKGRGVVADRRFQRGEFVVEYVGDLISMTEAAEREKCYALDENAGCYMYYFKHKNQQYCIDATVDTGKLGRLVNHSRNGNLITKVVVVKQRPHLVLLAKDDILAGEELTYDYGDRSKESLLHHPWLAF